MWKIKHIFDGNYGCEEASEEQTGELSLTLINENGEERYVSVTDAWMTEKGLDEGSIWPERFLFRDIRMEEKEEVTEIEQICFPPNEACSARSMKERVETAPELLTILGVLCVLLLLGLSAIGPVPIYLFTMLYGAGAGLLTFQLFSGIPLPQALFFLFISGIPAALAAGALCWFGSCALEVSGRLHAFSLGRGRSPSAHAQLLLGQFALTAAAMLPLCGAATCLAYLGSQLAAFP